MQYIIKKDPFATFNILRQLRKELIKNTIENQERIPRKFLLGKNKIARMLPLEHTPITSSEQLDLIKPFPNRHKSYRFNGNIPLIVPEIEQTFVDIHDRDMGDGESATYVATLGKNGLYGSITSETSYYKDQFADKDPRTGKKYYESILSGATHHLKDYFDIDFLMHDRTIVVHDITNPIYYIDLDEPFTRNAILTINKKIVFEFIQLLKDFSVRLPDLNDENALFEFLMYGNFYDFSQPIGNALMSTGLSIKFTSARRRTIQNSAYDEGSHNLAIPLSLYPFMPQNGTYYKSEGQKMVKITKQGKSTFAKYGIRDDIRF